MAKNGKQSIHENLKDKRLTTKKSTKTQSLTHQKNVNLPFITFSFKYFTQQDFFGIGQQNASWFTNLIDRLKDLSSKTSQILENYTERNQYRLHPINWNSRNCPIQQKDLQSVPTDIRNNTEDDIFWQFQLSKGTGRVVGYFNANHTIFYIVLLDPKHNIQPSKDYGYKVDETEMALTEYERILIKLAENNKLLNKCKHKNECPISNLINTEYIKSDIFLASIDTDLKDTYKSLIEEGNFQEKFEDFLTNEYCKDNNNSN